MVAQLRTLCGCVVVVGKVCGDWLKDVGGRDRVVIPPVPFVEKLDVVEVGQLADKQLKLSLGDEAREGPRAVAVPQ